MEAAVRQALEDNAKKGLEDSARAALPTDILDAADLEILTGVPKGTWRYWASIGQAPPSFKLGRRRVWRRADVETWIAAQEAASA